MEFELKKILIISSYAPPSLGGPQSLYNLLKDFPPDSYYILTSFYNIDNLSAKKGTWLEGEYIFYDNPKIKKEMLKSEKVISEKKGRSLIFYLKHLVKRSTIIRNVLGIPIIFSQIKMIIDAGKKAIEEKKPEILLAFSDYGPAMISSYFLHKKTKKPFVVFFFDLYKGNYFPFPGGILASIFEPKIIRSAEKIIVTNEGTKEFYIKRYGSNISSKITVIHNSTFAEPYLKFHSPFDPKPPYTILYTGRIYWPQIRSIKNLIKAIEAIKEMDIVFKIYCPNPPDYLKKLGIRESKKVKILKPLPPEEIPKVQTKADILFLPLSWQTKSPDIINTATPGKLAEYLISGRPILIHAPPSSFLTKYAKEKNFGLVVDEENIEKLIKGIKKILTNKNFSEKIIENAKRTFFENHDIQTNSKKFKSIFAKK